MAQDLNWENPRFKSMGFEFLDEKIFVKRNVLSQKYISQLKNILDGFSEEEWIGHGNYEVGDQPEDSFAIDKVSPPIEGIGFLNDAILLLIAPEYWNIAHLYMSRLKVGQIPGLQVVNYVSDNGETQFHIDYVGTIPIGDWEGGEYFFPKKDITVKLNSGDLLIFGGHEDYQIDVKPLTKGIRYTAYSPIVKHPGWLVL
jgi:hypothetical protein